MIKRHALILFIWACALSATAQTEIKRDTTVKDWMYYHNTYVAYYKLHAPADTVFKYIYRTLRYDPVMDCKYLFDLPSPYETFPKDYEPGRIKNVKRYCDSIYRTYDSATIRLLVKIKKDDETYRPGAMTKPSAHDAAWQKQHGRDSLNQLLIADLITRKGQYIGRYIVGYDMESVAYNVIRHAGLTYQEKYLPLIKDAIDHHQLPPYLYPELADKINMEKDIPQIYGTQLIYNPKRDLMELYKVKDMAHIDELRNKYDLGTLKKFLEYHNAYLPLK